MKYSKYLIPIVFFFSYCTEMRYAYAPVAPNTPGLKEKGDSKLGATASIGYYPGLGATVNTNMDANLNIQSAYALTNHFAVMASYTGTLLERDQAQYGDNATTYSEIVNYKRNQLETGAGVFFPLNQKKTLLVECFVGAGFGKLKITDRYVENGNNTSNGFYTTRTNKFFIQPSLTLHPGNNFFLSLGFRYVNSGYSNIKTSYTEQQTKDYYLHDIKSNRVGFIEPFLTANFRFKEVPWFMLQYQNFFTDQVSTQLVNHRFSYNNLGVVIDPTLLFQKKKK
ncbi:MAG: hypothetical protein K2Q24_02435 [Chitinophagaceae bacterium]|nr:hypothetical protein [Chitinophagaceae bacterium]